MTIALIVYCLKTGYVGDVEVFEVKFNFLVPSVVVGETGMSFLDVGFRPSMTGFQPHFLNL